MTAREAKRLCKCGHTELFHKFPSIFRWIFRMPRKECHGGVHYLKCDCKKFVLDYESNAEVIT